MRFNEQLLSKSNNNFDFLRLMAAFLVLIGHAPLILGQKFYSWDPFKILFGHNMHAFGVVVFFVISGFLVAGSWERRHSVFSYFKARILRIFPGLIVAVLIGTFVLGLLLTTKEPGEYLSSVQTYQYLFNITLLRISYNLPGVFENNPIASSINGSLWSLPYEFCCYIVLACFAFLTQIKLGKYLYLSLALITYACYLLFQPVLDSIYLSWIDIRLNLLFPYLLYFLAGAAYFQLRNYLRFNFWFFIAALGLCFVIQQLKVNDAITAFVLPYVILYLAFLQTNSLAWVSKFGDLSYGVYLYAFPIQQLWVFCLPAKLNPLTLIILTALSVLPVAYLSWRFVEKPALNLK